MQVLLLQIVKERLRAKKTVVVHYLEEKELTADEKQSLENFQQSHTVEDGGEAYYFVYRPSEKTLPNTGSKEIGALAVAGTSLLVAALVLSRKSKRLAVTFFALGSGGLLTTTVLADSQLAQFFDTIQVVLGGDIPHPKTILGYQFTGYFYRKGQSQPTPVLQPQDSKDQTDKNALPIKPVTPETPVKPDGNKDSQPVTPQPDKPQPNQPEKPEVQVRESEKVDILPFQTITKEDPTLAKGQTKVEVAGKNGQKVTKVREFYTIAKDGRETIVRSEILSTQEIKAIDQVVLIGTKEVQPDKPQPKPIETAKGDQTDGGSANVEPALPEFPVKPLLETKVVRKLLPQLTQSTQKRLK